MKRYGSIIKIKSENVDEYRKLHAEPWPEVIEIIKTCNIQNYSIYYKDGLLFTYYEYVGSDFDKDMKKMAADATTQKWWDVCKPFQEPLETKKEGEWWAEMEEFFHLD